MDELCDFIEGGNPYGTPPPNKADVRGGEALLWKWEDGNVAHTVTADDGSFDSGEKTTGEFRHTFDRPGTYSYHCENHPEMTGAVSVSG